MSQLIFWLKCATNSVILNDFCATLMRYCLKMVRHALYILQHLLQNFEVGLTILGRYASKGYHYFPLPQKYVMKIKGVFRTPSHCQSRISSLCSYDQVGWPGYIFLAFYWDVFSIIKIKNSSLSTFISFSAIKFTYLLWNKYMLSVKMEYNFT